MSNKGGSIALRNSGDKLKSLEIEVWETDADFMYRHEEVDGILAGRGLLIPKRLDTIDAMRACLDDAERRMKHAMREKSQG
jgi:hypothetical protein